MREEKDAHRRIKIFNSFLLLLLLLRLFIDALMFKLKVHHMKNLAEIKFRTHKIRVILNDLNLTSTYRAVERMTFEEENRTNRKTLRNNEKLFGWRFFYLLKFHLKISF